MHSAAIPLPLLFTPIDLGVWVVMGGIVLLILGLSAVCAATLRRAAGQLASEGEYLRQCQLALASVTPDMVPREGDPADWVLDQCRCGEGGRTSIIGRRIRRMGALSRTRLAGETLLTELLNRREDLRPEDARFVGSILVFVALIGTVASLAIAVWALPRFDPSSLDYDSLHRVIRQVSYAFGITCVGILCTVIVAWLNHRFTHEQDEFLLDLEEYSLEKLAPLLMGRPQAVEIPRIEALQEEMVRAAGSLKSVIERMWMGAEERAQAFQKVLVDGATAFATDVGDAATTFTNGARQMAEVGREAAGAVQPAIDAARTLADLSDRAAQTIQQSAGRLDDALRSFSACSTLLPSQIHSLEGTCSRISQAVETLRDDQIAARGDMARVLSEWQGVGERLETLKSTMQQTNLQVGQALQAVCNDFKAEQVVFLDSVRRLTEAAQHQLTEAAALHQEGRGHLVRVSEQFQQAAERYHDSSTRTFDALYEQLIRLMEGAGPAVNALAGSAVELQRTTAALREAAESQPLVHVSRLVADLPGNVAAALGDAAVSTELRQAAVALHDSAQRLRPSQDGELLDVARRVADDTRQATHAMQRVHDALVRMIWFPLPAFGRRKK